MSNESATNQVSIAGRLRGPGSRRVALGAGLLVVLVAAGVTLGARHGSGSGSTPTAASGGQPPGSVGGAGAHGTASPTSGSSGATSTGSGQHGSGGGHSASPTPLPTLAPAPTKSGIAGTGNWKSSNCADTFVPGDVCIVQYSGEYYLVPPNPGATVLIKAMKADGTVLVSQSYAAPTGGHRFGARLSFSIPDGVHEVDMESLLLDSSGKTITTSIVQQDWAA